MVPTIRFDRGTLRVDHLQPDQNPAYVVWDPRTHCWRAPAFLYRNLLGDLRKLGVPFHDEMRQRLVESVGPWKTPRLRDYQRESLQAWRLAGRKGVVVLPTGAGKTRVAIAAMADVAMPAIVLCPTRALLNQWVEELRIWCGAKVGVVGDGQRILAPITVTTFASAYTQMDSFGSRFCLLVVDEVHHFGGGRGEALEMCPAPYRLGLTATAPEAQSDAARNIDRLVGPIVHQVPLEKLIGKHLADLDVAHLRVRLHDDELLAYSELEAPFSEMCRAHFRMNPQGGFAGLVQSLCRTPMGRKAMSDHQKACSIASFPKEKRALVRSLLARHTNDKTLVFTALAEDAYTVAMDNLIPVITAEVGRAERTEILRSFREGRIRAIVSARVLNEGLDVPDASVGIVVAGTQGAREHVQRVGRVLRPAPGKRALVYELITIGTLDHARALSRWGYHAA